MSSLPLTGERTVPGLAREQYWFARHEVVYRWLAPRTAGRTVLEAGSGEGYGAALLAGHEARVLALDYDAATVAHSAATYPQVGHVRANLAALPVHSVDVVVCLQVIEHLWDLPGFLAEVRRIATYWAAISTPNRLTFSPGLGRADKPVNPFHVEEFDADQVTDLLRTAGFTTVEMFAVTAGPRLAARPSLIEEQVAAVLADQWPAELERFVGSVTADDFVVVPAAETEMATSLDLLAVAR